MLSLADKPLMSIHNKQPNVGRLILYEWLVSRWWVNSLKICSILSARVVKVFYYTQVLFIKCSKAFLEKYHLKL